MSRVSESRRSFHFSLKEFSSRVAVSLRRLGKSAMSLTGKRQSKKRDRSVKEAGPVTYIDPRKKVNWGAVERWDRKVDGERFSDYYIYDGSIDTKVYINSGGMTNSWKDKSAGRLWVAVYGARSICVAWKGDLELKRFPITNEICNLRRYFALNVISHVEAIKRSTKDSPQTLDKPVKKPFAVVCLIPSTTDVHQESSDEVIKDSGAVNYLKEKLKSGSDFDRTETIQTALSALQHQCNKEFIVIADDIWVCVLQDGIDVCLRGKEIEKHLAEINKPSAKPLQTSEVEEQTKAPLQTSEIEERADTVVEAPVQTSEIEERADTVVEAPVQTSEIKTNESQTSEI